MRGQLHFLPSNMSVTVHRSSPLDNLVLPSLMLVAVETPLDIAASLASSLSGPLTDYIIREQLPMGISGPVWSVTAKACYQQRFREGQQKLCLSEMKLREAEEKLVKTDQITNDREICLTTMEVYSRLEIGKIVISLYSLHHLTSILQSLTRNGFPYCLGLSKKTFSQAPLPFMCVHFSVPFLY